MKVKLLNGYYCKRLPDSFTWFLTFMSKCVMHTPYKYCNTMQIAKNSLSLLIVALLITVNARLLLRADGDEPENSRRKEKRDYSIEYYNLMRQAAPLLFFLLLFPSFSLSLSLTSSLRPSLPSTAYISVHHVFRARSSVANSTLEEKFTGHLFKKLTQNSDLALAAMKLDTNAKQNNHRRQTIYLSAPGSRNSRFQIAKIKILENRQNIRRIIN